MAAASLADKAELANAVTAISVPPSSSLPLPLLLFAIAGALALPPPGSTVPFLSWIALGVGIVRRERRDGRQERADTEEPEDTASSRAIR